MLQMTLRRHCFCFALALLWAVFSCSTAALGVTYEYDELNRLTGAAWDQGTIIEYTYDAAGNRLLRKVLGVAPPEVRISPMLDAYSIHTWESEGTICGTAESKSGHGITSAEVCLGLRSGGGIRFWGMEGWISSCPLWNAVIRVNNEWVFPMDRNNLQEGEYILLARAKDAGGFTGFSETRTFSFDSTAPLMAEGSRILDASHILINFSEEVEGAGQRESYSLSEGLSVIDVTQVEATAYQLTLSGDLVSGADYTLTLLDIYDLAGNPYEPDYATIYFRLHAPVAPGLHSPSEGSEVADLQPFLAVSNGFDQDGDPLTYDFEVYADESFTEMVLSAEGVREGLNITSWQVAEPLTDNTGYFWRACALDGIFRSPWCEGRFFVNLFNDPPTTPVPDSPPDGSEVPDLRPVLEVVNGRDPDRDTLFYDFEICLDDEMTVSVCAVEGILEGDEGTTLWQAVMDLNDNTSYYWRARCRDDHEVDPGFSPWSVPSMFRVNTFNDPPSATSILEPSPGGEIDELDPLLKVLNASDPDLDALFYCFEVDRVKTLDGPWCQRSGAVEEGPGQETSWSPPEALGDNTVHYWRVRASDGGA